MRRNRWFWQSSLVSICWSIGSRWHRRGDNLRMLCQLGIFRRGSVQSILGLLCLGLGHVCQQSMFRVCVLFVCKFGRMEIFRVCSLSIYILIDFVFCIVSFSVYLWRTICFCLICFLFYYVVKHKNHFSDMLTLARTARSNDIFTNFLFSWWRFSLEVTIRTDALLKRATCL